MAHKHLYDHFLNVYSPWNQVYTFLISFAWVIYEEVLKSLWYDSLTIIWLNNATSNFLVLFGRNEMFRASLCMYVYVWVWIWIYICTYLDVHAFMCTYLYVYIYVIASNNLYYIDPVYGYNTAKTAHHSKIFVRAISMIGSNWKNKAISSFISRMCVGHYFYFKSW